MAIESLIGVAAASAMSLPNSRAARRRRHRPYAPGPGVRVSVNGQPVDSHLRTVLAKHPCRSLTG